jgi:hypothetical protein
MGYNQAEYLNSSACVMKTSCNFATFLAICLPLVSPSCCISHNPIETLHPTSASVIILEQDLDRALRPFDHLDPEESPTATFAKDAEIDTMFSKDDVNALLRLIGRIPRIDHKIDSIKLLGYRDFMAASIWVDRYQIIVVKTASDGWQIVNGFFTSD